MKSELGREDLFVNMSSAIGRESFTIFSGKQVGGIVAYVFDTAGGVGPWVQYARLN